MNPKDVIKGLVANNSLPDQISKFLGFKLISCLDGKWEIELDVTEKHHNPFGSVQGGNVSDLVEQTMIMAFYSTLNEGEAFVTLNLQLNFFKPVNKDKIKATAVCTSRGKSIGFLECNLVTSQQTLIAKANTTCKIIQVSKK